MRRDQGIAAVRYDGNDGAVAFPCVPVGYEMLGMSEGVQWEWSPAAVLILFYIEKKKKNNSHNGREDAKS